MRLINASTLKLESFADNAIPEYAALSHTWGKEADEVSFQEMQSSDGPQKPGWGKIEYSCKQALSDRLTYVWIDTCCTIQTHHRRQRPTKRVAYAAENGGRTYIAFQYECINISLPSS
jgi:hypothetical protein